MPIITRFSPQLNKMMDFASKRIGKPFIVKTNSALSAQGNDLVISIPDRMDLHSRIPIYICSERAINAAAEGEEMSVETEFEVANNLAAHMAYADGYRSMEDVVFTYKRSELSSLGDDTAGLYSRSLQTIIDGMSGFSWAILTHNIAASFGFDPAKCFYENNYFEARCSRPELFSMEEFQQKMNLNIDPLLHSGTLRVLMFTALLELAKLYIFLPQPQREDLAQYLDPFTAEALSALLMGAQLDASYEYYVGDMFLDRCTRNAFSGLQKAVLDHLIGISGENIRLQRMEQGAVDQAKLSLAGQASNNFDFFSSYSILCSIKRADVKYELARAKRALFREVNTLNPDFSQEQVHRRIVKVLSEREMKRSAIIYQEEQYGETADLDPA